MPRNGQVRLSAPRLYSMNRILPLNATPHLSSKRAHGLSRSLKSLTVNPELQRSEEHTSELQSLMRISYAVFCLKKQKCSIYSYFHIILLSMTYLSTYYISTTLITII